jgi:hypothetical protein
MLVLGPKLLLPHTVRSCRPQLGRRTEKNGMVQIRDEQMIWKKYMSMKCMYEHESFFPMTFTAKSMVEH